LVDLNYTAVLDGTSEEQSFYALQVRIRAVPVDPGGGNAKSLLPCWKSSRKLFIYLIS
jgi:hypothetical protein